MYDYSATVRLLCWLGDKIETHTLDRYRRYKGGQLNPLSQPFKVAVEVLDRFATEVKAAGATPLVVLWAEPATVERSRRGQLPTYQTLLDVIKSRGIPYLDTVDAFRAAPDAARWETWFHDEIHYSPTGNRIVADWLGRKLQKRAQQRGPNHALTSTPTGGPATAHSARDRR